MKRPLDLHKEVENTVMLADLTDVFEGLASMRISQVKNQVLQSQNFFDRLWQMYIQIRAGSSFNFGRHTQSREVINKELFVVITSEGSFSGDIDHKLINWMLQNYDQKLNDIIVIGHHGAVQLSQQGIDVKKYFKLPAKDQNLNLLPIIKEIQNYKSTVVYYQTYISLTVQDVKRINLNVAVEERGKDVKASEEIINETTYIFEPSAFAVVDHLERSMMNIALTQVLLESKLAQHASRFQAMSIAHQRANESVSALRLAYNRSMRYTKDERLKEIINGLKKVVQA